MHEFLVTLLIRRKSDRVKKYPEQVSILGFGIHPYAYIIVEIAEYYQSFIQMGNFEFSSFLHKMFLDIDTDMCT